MGLFVAGLVLGACVGLIVGALLRVASWADVHHG